MDKYKNKNQDMPLHVPESLFEHYLYENSAKSDDLFRKAGFDKNDDVVLKFKEAFSDIPDFQGKFAEWILDIVDEDDNWEESDIDLAIRQIESVKNEIKAFLNQGYKMDFDPEPITGIQNFINKLHKSAKKQRSDFKINSEPLILQIKNPLQLKLPGMSGDRLWIYGVLIKTKDGTYVKFGDHRGPNEDDAIEYAMSQTIGKARGLVSDTTEVDVQDLQEQGKNVDAVSLIFVEDVTDYAATKGYPVERQKFDDYIRHRMPGSWGVIKNSKGQASNELHQHNTNEPDWKIISDWKNAIEKMLDEGGVPKKKEKVEARPFHNEMIKKLDLKENGTHKSDKHLLGAATGAGKELVTLSTLIHINDSRKELFDKNTVHVAVATFPSTISELFKELANKSGIKTEAGDMDFSRIKPYCLKKFANKYGKDLPGPIKEWFDNPQNVKQIETINEIKGRNENEIPVLFGSFVDLGLKTIDDPKETYKSLGDRIGILSIGEAHQFLSNAENKLWKNIKEKLRYKFLLVITGTPYDFIFNEAGADYFAPEERTIFTRNDLYELKRKNPKGPFGKYPDINYFNLDIGNIYEDMRKSPKWEDDRHGFTWQKFFEIENNNFKYSTLISKFFSKLFSVDYDTGLPDPLSIQKVPEEYLSESAKSHVIVALPIGSGKNSVEKYIPKLVEMLKKRGALGDYIPLDPYTDNLKDIKEIIDNKKSRTITFTCNKYLTGTDIPAWGTLIFLRPIGSSIKFFEQATGRIARALKDGEKDEVGVFLGNLENAVNLHISVDELMVSERNEGTPYDEIVRKTLKNYNWIKPDKHGEWSLITDWQELADLQGELAGDIDYGTILCLKKTKAPAGFDLKFKKSIKDAENQIEISSSGNKGAKNKEIESKIKQLKIEFKEFNKDPEKWYRNMIISHIPKIIAICVINRIKTIEEFSDRIKKDKELLELIGMGSEFVKSYIDSEDQINKKYLNRKISIILDESADGGGKDNFIKRYNIVNEKLDISELSENLIFDPIKLTDEICSKISDPLLSADRILIIEKNGSFLYSVLKEAGYDQLKNLTLIILDPLSKEIIDYILGLDKELPKILYIKDIEEGLNEILNMPKFDVVIGNPPFQPFGSSGTGNKIWPKFIESGFGSLKDGGIISMITPNNWRLSNLKNGVERDAQKLMWENNILDISPANKFFSVGGNVRMDYWIIEKGNSHTGLDIDGELRNIMFYPYENQKEIIDFYRDIKEGDNFEMSIPRNRGYNYDSILKSSSGDKKHPYPHINTFAQYNKGLFDWYDKKSPGFDEKKVIISDMSSLRSNMLSLYNNGGIGSGTHSWAFPVDNKNEGSKLENFINNSRIIRDIFKSASDPNGFGLYLHLIKRIPKSWVDRFNNGENL